MDTVVHLVVAGDSDCSLVVWRQHEMSHQSSVSSRSDLSKHVAGGHVPDDDDRGRGHDVLAVGRDGRTERRKPMTFE